MTGQPYVVLLRAINVGGRNKVPMAELREVLTAAGLSDVRTYIQSGNVVCRSALAHADLVAHVEDTLAESFGFDVPVVARDAAAYRTVVAQAPQGFGQEPETYHSDVLFLKGPLTAQDVLGQLRPREGVDSAWAGDGVVYFRRLSARRSQSRLSGLVSTPAYPQVTNRNWNTTVRLAEMLDELS